MTILSVNDLLETANKISGNYAGPLIYQLEDVIDQLMIWMVEPEKLSVDEGLHAGIKCLARVMLGIKEKEGVE